MRYTRPHSKSHGNTENTFILIVISMLALTVVVGFAIFLNGLFEAVEVDERNIKSCISSCDNMVCIEKCKIN